MLLSPKRRQTLTIGEILRDRQIPDPSRFLPSKCCYLLPHGIRRKNTLNYLNYYRFLGNYYLPVRKSRESEPVKGVFSKRTNPSKKPVSGEILTERRLFPRGTRILSAGGDCSIIVSHIQDDEHQAPLWVSTGEGIKFVTRS